MNMLRKFLTENGSLRNGSLCIFFVVVSYCFVITTFQELYLARKRRTIISYRGAMSKMQIYMKPIN